MADVALGVTRWARLQSLDLSGNGRAKGPRVYEIRVQKRSVSGRSSKNALKHVIACVMLPLQV